MKDCTTCKYGFVDEQLGIPMCHHPKRFSEDCVDFNMHEEVEEPEKATGIEETPSDELEKVADEKVVKELSKKVSDEIIRQVKDALAEQSVTEDLEKELDRWRHQHFDGKRDEKYSGEYLERTSQLELARHFYELGLNARKEDAK